MTWKGAFQRFKKREAQHEPKNTQATTRECPFHLTGSGRGRQFEHVCSRPPQVLGFNGGEKKSTLCLNRTWLSQCCFGNEDQEMGNLC